MIRQRFSSFDLYRWNSLNSLKLNCGCAAGVNFALHAPAGLSVPEVRENRKALSAELAVPSDQWICANQVHGTSSRILSASDRGRGALDADDALPDTDALILAEPGLAVMIFTADCLPLLLYDRRRAVSALIHAGWRGAAGGIVPKVLNRMRDELDCRTEDILAAAGPAIGSCCYQVDLPVYKGMCENFPATDAAFHPDHSNGMEEHWRLNLEEAVFLQLEQEGLKREQMEGSGLCSCCSSSDLSSWRREGHVAGRMATFFCS